MSYPYWLAGNFVEGKVQRDIVFIYQHLDIFIETFAPILENVYARLKMLGSQIYENLRSHDIEENIRADFHDAEQGLVTYNVLYSQIANRLAIMSSNFKLPQFLKEHNIPPDQIPIFQNEVRQYWDETYGLVIERIRKVIQILGRMRILLQEQINVLRSVPQASYISGFDESLKLRQLFLEERQLFWLIVKEAPLSGEEVGRVKASFLAAKKRLSEDVKAHITIIRRGFTTDFEASEDKVIKGLVVTMYLLGAAKVFMDLEKDITEKGISSLFRVVSSWRNRRLSREISSFGVSVEKSVKSLVADSSLSSLYKLLKVLAT